MFSFIIPAHNEELFLRNTLNSIKIAVEDNQLTYEIIVVNDDSTDNTPQIIDDFPAQRVDVKLRKISAVRNAGAKLARGEFLIFVDADTLLPSQTLKQVIAELNQGTQGGGAYVSVDPPITWSQWVIIKTFSFCWLRIGNWAAGCFIYIRKDLFEQIGGFDENYYAAEELYLSRAIKSRGKFKIVSHAVLTSGRKLRMNSTWKFLKWSLPVLLAGPKAWRQKEGLDILYESKRDIK